MSDKTPWDWMSEGETKILGEIVLDPVEQARWCRSILFGTLPYMWRDKAAALRTMMYDRLAPAPGDKVLILGECIQGCGFDADIRERIGPDGEIDIIDITEKARGAYMSGVRGRGGQLATWRFDYTNDVPDAHYDSVAVLQGVTHTDDWFETSRELVRILKPGRNILLAEIAIGPKMLMKAELDIHIEAWIEKIFSRMGWKIDQFPYYSLDDLRKAFDGVVERAETFEWKGIELFWGSKPA